MNLCAFCGRDNEPASRFCIDCGKPLVPASVPAPAPARAGVPSPSPQIAAPVSARVGAGAAIPPTRVSQPPATPRGASATPAGAQPARCPSCGRRVNPSLPFCGHCGTRTGLAASAGAAVCPSCGGGYSPGIDRFCAHCGTKVPIGGDASPTVALSAQARDAGPRLSLLDGSGGVAQSYVVDRGEAIIGRADGDIRFPDDVYLSPIHAQFAVRDGELWVRDLGSRNGSWVFLDGPYRLQDNDLLLVGSQMLRFRRLGYPGPHPPEIDATRRMGSLVPSADIAVLAQLRADGSARDSFHLSPGRAVIIGRESGDWVFPYDQTMSGRHAEIRSEDGEFILADAGSRNGVAVAVRGERTVRRGQRVLVGDQILRVDSV